jgi:CRISPR/Cas system-associated endoribonuclease Cas2
MMEHSQPQAQSRTSTARIMVDLLENPQRRTGTSITPTRTLHITHSEQQVLRHPHSDPNHISRLVDVAQHHRPRSNPRSRTPMRFESPLAPDSFREPSPSPERPETRRVTIRPFAGHAIGTVPGSSSISEENRNNNKSRKQGPSHRKVRRWNNDHFTNLAAEIQSLRGVAAAEVLLQAQKDAPLYRSVYDFQESKRSAKITEFMEDDKMKRVREQFFEGEGPQSTTTTHRSSQKQLSVKDVDVITAMDMYHRIEPRLRRLVVRAFRNSYAAAKVIGMLEEFLITSLEKHRDGNRSKVSMLAENWWSGILLEPPTITRHTNPKDDGAQRRYTIQFLFDAESSTGGFHRLLLQAIAQFHGLHVICRMVHGIVRNEAKDTISARGITVTGHKLDTQKVPFRMLQYMDEQVGEDESLTIGDPRSGTDWIVVN